MRRAAVAIVAVLCLAAPAAAQNGPPFQGTAAELEAYRLYQEGKPVAATVHFQSAKNEADVSRAFDEHRLQVQTKPMLLTGAEAFWSAKTGQMNVRKGRTWAQLTVGGTKVTERDTEAAKKLADILVKKL